jgi:acyl-CoA thioester hydrolase
LKSSELQWDYANVFQMPVVVSAEAIDSYGHVNNVVYIQWLADCAWAHSAAVGLPEEICVSMGRGMAVRSFHVDLLGAAHESDALYVGDWVSSNDERLRATRIFQILNSQTGATLLRGHIDYVCINLTTGRPVRMSAAFVEGYQVTLPQ